MAFSADDQIADAMGLMIQFEVFTKHVKKDILKKSLSALLKKKAAMGKAPAAAIEETPKEPAEKEPKAEDKVPAASAEEPQKDADEPVAAEDELKLKAGDKVKVAFEDLLHKLQCGVQGQCYTRLLRVRLLST